MKTPCHRLYTNLGRRKLSDIALKAIWTFYASRYRVCLVQLSATLLSASSLTASLSWTGTWTTRWDIIGSIHATRDFHFSLQLAIKLLSTVVNSMLLALFHSLTMKFNRLFDAILSVIVVLRQLLRKLETRTYDASCCYYHNLFYSYKSNNFRGLV